MLAETYVLLKEEDCIILNLKEENIDSSDLKEIYILGKCGWYMDKNGNDIERCPKCGQVSLKVQNELAGLRIIEDTWDGSDIFSFSNWLGVMICTERLKEACEKEKILND